MNADQTDLGRFEKAQEEARVLFDVSNLAKYYDTDKREYHNADHIIRMLTTLYYHKKELQKAYALLYDPDAWLTLLEAILWHDVYYEFGASDNEEKSRNLYMNTGGCGQTIQHRENVAKAIMSTKFEGSMDVDNCIQIILHDLDYFDFYKLWRLREHEHKINKEAIAFGKQVTTRQWVDFYKGLDKKRIFFSELMRECEEVAHKNIRDRISDLQKLLPTQKCATCIRYGTLMDANGKVVSKGFCEFHRSMPEDGWCTNWSYKLEG